MHQKIDLTTIDDAEDLDLVMLMYNLIKYSSILKMKQLILMQIVLMTEALNCLNIRPNWKIKLQMEQIEF